MIKDALVQATLVATTAGAAFGGSIGLDLNPDFGNGHSPRKAGMPGAGADFAIKCRVSQAFAVGNGAPILQVYAVLSTAGDPGIPGLVISGNYVAVGCQCAPMQLDGSNLVPGFIATELTLNTEFYIKCNPWTFSMARGIPGSLDGEERRFLGLILNTINHTAGANEFSAGIINGNIVLASDLSQQAAVGSGRGPIHFPSGVVNK